MNEILSPSPLRSNRLTFKQILHRGPVRVVRTTPKKAITDLPHINHDNIDGLVFKISSMQIRSNLFFCFEYLRLSERFVCNSHYTSATSKVNGVNNPINKFINQSLFGHSETGDLSSCQGCMRTHRKNTQR